MKSPTIESGKGSRRPPSGATEVEPHDHDRPAAGAGSPAAVVERAAALFRAVGDAARLALLERLAHGEQCVSEIALATGENLSTVSERLRVLRTEGLVAGRREGKHVYYAVADAHVADIVRAALQHVSEDVRWHRAAGQEENVRQHEAAGRKKERK